ncbi:4-hydroxy-3-methylbut-2-en-1-yl diphosphate reductase [Candidatus Magnetomoraceae bacterium gMMP-1]
MKIQLARTAGFCMGVRRAVDMVLDASNNAKAPVYTYGPLIHNPQVLEILSQKNISVLKEIPEKSSATVLIRAHGIPPEEKQKLINAGFNVIDATCPRVIKVQTIIKKFAKKGYAVIILGDKDHAEVRGLLGYASSRGWAVNSLKKFEKLSRFDKAIVVAQTTQDISFFKLIKERIEDSFPHYKVFNTICDSTAKRQVEVKKIADSSDAVIVVGGHNSGNTQRLAQVVKNQGIPSYHIETESELNMKLLKSAENIGITAGASTPNWIIKEVYNAVEELLNDRGWARKFLFNLQQALLVTNIYVALGAGCLCYMFMLLQDIQPSIDLVLMAFVYVLSMHSLNNLIGRKAERYNYPYRAAFYRKYQIPVIFMATIAGLAGLIMAYFQGTVPFLILLGMSILGLSYNLKLIPNSFAANCKYQSIRQIPGSRTVLIAVAWGIVTTILPAISVKAYNFPNTLFIFLWAAGLVFVRTAFFDILDMQGNRIVGQETLSILLGEEKTMKLLKIILILIFAGVLLSYLIGFTGNLSLCLLLCIASMTAVLIAHENTKLPPGFRLEFLLESHFVMAGLLSFVWIN